MHRWPRGMAKCDEYKHDEVNLAAVDFILVHLFYEILVTDIVF